MTLLKRFESENEIVGFNKTLITKFASVFGKDDKIDTAPTSDYNFHIFYLR